MTSPMSPAIVRGFLRSAGNDIHVSKTVKEDANSNINDVSRQAQLICLFGSSPEHFRPSKITILFRISRNGTSVFW